MQPDAIALMSFDGMTKGVPQVERGANPRLTFIRPTTRALAAQERSMAAVNTPDRGHARLPCFLRASQERAHRKSGRT